MGRGNDLTICLCVPEHAGALQLVKLLTLRYNFPLTIEEMLARLFVLGCRKLSFTVAVPVNRGLQVLNDQLGPGDLHEQSVNDCVGRCRRQRCVHLHQRENSLPRWKWAPVKRPVGNLRPSPTPLTVHQSCIDHRCPHRQTS
jgi:hypothetical protein